MNLTQPRHRIDGHYRHEITRDRPRSAKTLVGLQNHRQPHDSSDHDAVAPDRDHADDNGPADFWTPDDADSDAFYDDDLTAAEASALDAFEREILSDSDWELDASPEPELGDFWFDDEDEWN